MSCIGSSNDNILDPPPGTEFSDFLRTWGNGHVAQWLSSIKCCALIETFRNHDIRGDLLLELDQDILKEMGIASMGDRLRIVNGLKGLRDRCSPPNASPSVSAIAHTRPSMTSLEVESSREPSITNPAYQPHSRLPSRLMTSPRNSSPMSSTHNHLDSNRPSRSVLSPGSRRPDLPNIIREIEPRSCDSTWNVSAIPPPPQTGPSAPSTIPGSETIVRPSSLPLSPMQLPRPSTTRAGPRTLDPLIIPHIRMPDEADAAHHANSPLFISPTSAGSNTPTISFASPQSSRWSSCSFGLPANPRSPPPNMRPQTRSPTPLGSLSSPGPCAANITHNRNISFNDVSSSLGLTPTEANLAPRSLTPGTIACPYVSTPALMSHSLRTPGQNGFSLSPITESSRAQGSGSTSRSSSRSSSPLTASLRRCSLNPTPRIASPSLNNLRGNLVKFIMPEEGRSYVVDVTDCADGIEVVEKVLKKAEKAGLQRRHASDVISPVETGDGGFSVDGWSVYLEWDEASDSGNPLSEAELQAVCHSSSYYSVKVRGLTLRKTKQSEDLHQIFGEDPPTSPSPIPTPSVSDHEADSNEPLAAFAKAIGELQDKKLRTIKGATTVSIFSVHDAEKALDPLASSTQGRPKNSHPSSDSVKKLPKLRNFFGHQLTTHLTEHFPCVESKALRNARQGMMLVSGEKSGPPLPSRFSASTHSSASSGSKQRSRISDALNELWETMKRAPPYY